MREATGDLNLTVIVVVAVAGLMAFFSMVVWPMIRGGMRNSENCSDAICEKVDTNKDGMVNCTRKGKTGSFQCPYKG